MQLNVKHSVEDENELERTGSREGKVLQGWVSAHPIRSTIGFTGRSLRECVREQVSSLTASGQAQLVRAPELGAFSIEES